MRQSSVQDYSKDWFTTIQLQIWRFDNLWSQTSVFHISCWGKRTKWRRANESKSSCKVKVINKEKFTKVQTELLKSMEHEGGSQPPSLVDWDAIESPQVGTFSSVENTPQPALFGNQKKSKEEIFTLPFFFHKIPLETLPKFLNNLLKFRNKLRAPIPSPICLIARLETLTPENQEKRPLPQILSSHLLSSPLVWWVGTNLSFPISIYIWNSSAENSTCLATKTKVITSVFFFFSWQ